MLKLLYFLIVLSDFGGKMHQNLTYNPLLKYKIPDWYKLEACAYNKVHNDYDNWKLFLEMEENIMGRGGMLGTSIFSFFTYVFKSHFLSCVNFGLFAIGKWLIHLVNKEFQIF